jgi:hypothetical protein
MPTAAMVAQVVAVTPDAHTPGQVGTRYVARRSCI